MDYNALLVIAIAEKQQEIMDLRTKVAALTAMVNAAPGSRDVNDTADSSGVDPVANIQ